MTIETAVTDPSLIDIVLAEDSEEIAEPFKAGLNHLIGIRPENLHAFLEIDEANRHLQTQPDTMPTVVILDNNTPHSGWTGYALAMRLLEERSKRPNLLVITLSSSDMGLVYRDSGQDLEALKQAGGEFWAKHYERYLMMLWLGDCLRRGVFVPREIWLTDLGRGIAYPDDFSPEDSAISNLCDNLLITNTPEQLLARSGLSQGDFLRRNPKEILAAMGFPKYLSSSSQG